jgi:hypothetical protein
LKFLGKSIALEEKPPAPLISSNTYDKAVPSAENGVIELEDEYGLVE